MFGNRSSVDERSARNSIYAATSNDAINTLRRRIKCIVAQSGPDLGFEASDHEVEVCCEQILSHKQTRSVRRVYLRNHKYKIGWVADCDFDRCMNCEKSFKWWRGRTKHHCRACGNLVCHECSPFAADIPCLDEQGGSRVCKNCFGLRPGIFSPVAAKGVQKVWSESAEDSFTPTADSISFLANSLNNNNINPSNMYSYNTSNTNTHSNTASSLMHSASVSDSLSQSSSTMRVRRRSTLVKEKSRLDEYTEEIDRIEREQYPRYLEAYQRMRELIPLDIYKSNIRRLVMQGLPEDTASRLFNVKILWLIVMHKEDIFKIHLADFRGKYFNDNLDIVEMRAVWHALPDWQKETDNHLEKGKAEWREGFKLKLDDLSYREAKGSLPDHLARHPAYESCDFLHLFDSDIVVEPRFHRSASSSKHPVLSPMLPASTDDDGSNLDIFGFPLPSKDIARAYSPLNINQRISQYNQHSHGDTNTATNTTSSGVKERRESAYRTLLEEMKREEGDKNSSNNADNKMNRELDELIMEMRKQNNTNLEGEQDLADEEIEIDDVSSLGLDHPVDTSMLDMHSPSQSLSLPSPLPSPSLSPLPPPYPSPPRRNNRYTTHANNNANNAMYRDDADASPSSSPLKTLRPSFRAPSQSPTQRMNNSAVYTSGKAKKTLSLTPPPPSNLSSIYPSPSPTPSLSPPSSSVPSSSLPPSAYASSPPSTNFYSVESKSSYKFLSSAKKYSRRNLLTSTGTPNDNPISTNQFSPSLVNNNTNSNAKLSSTLDKDQVVRLILQGDIDSVVQSPDLHLERLFSPTEAHALLSQLLYMTSASNSNGHLAGILFLLDEGVVDVNTGIAQKEGELDSSRSKSSLLHFCVKNRLEELGREVLKRGADIFLENSGGQCALSLSLTDYNTDHVNRNWLLEELVASRKEQLIMSSPTLQSKYLSLFFYAGEAEQAERLIRDYNVTVSEQEATALLNSVKGIFEKMKQPVETFELLEALGARFDE